MFCGPARGAAFDYHFDKWLIVSQKFFWKTLYGACKNSMEIFGSTFYAQYRPQDTHYFLYDQF